MFLMILYFVISIFFYAKILAIDFNYKGFEDNFSITKLIVVSLLLLLLNLSLVLFQKTKSLYAINYLLFVFFSIPNFIIYVFNDSFVIILFSISIIHIVLIFSDLFKKQIFKPFLSVKRHLFPFVILLFIFIFFDTIKAFNTDVFLFKDIYKQRIIGTNSMNFFSGYILNLLSKMLIPFLIVYFTSMKKYMVILVLLVFQFYLFGVISMKSIFFGTILILPFLFFKSFENLPTYFLSFLIIFTFFSFFLYYYGVRFFVDALVRRTFYTPAMLNVQYISFFTDHPSYFFNNYTESLPPPYLIGKIFYNSSKMNASNGFVGYGFLMFKNIGVILYSFFVSIIFLTVSRLKLSAKYFGFYILIIYTLLGSSLSTAILTHGLWFIFTLPFFIIKSNSYE